MSEPEPTTVADELTELARLRKLSGCDRPGSCDWADKGIEHKHSMRPRYFRPAKRSPWGRLWSWITRPTPYWR